jgi:hypothetical protein
MIGISLHPKFRMYVSTAILDIETKPKDKKDIHMCTIFWVKIVQNIRVTEVTCFLYTLYCASYQNAILSVTFVFVTTFPPRWCL